MRNKRWLSLVIAMMMFIALLPVYSVHAATAYFTFPSYAASPDVANTMPVSTSVVSSFYGSFSQAVPTNLSYSVQQMVQTGSGSSATWADKGIPNNMPNATPLISGPTGQEFTLVNVSLFVGMNKVTVSTSSGVEGVCYIFYDNAPVISNITLNNGLTLDASGPTYVDSDTQFFLIKASNASLVKVNGNNATSYGPSSFSLSNYKLNPGLNTLIFEAESATRQITITRQVVYVKGPGAAYNVTLQSNSSNSANNAVQIDSGNLVTAPAPLPQGIKGQVVFPSTSVVNSVYFTDVNLFRDGSPVMAAISTDLATTVTISNPPIDDNKGHKIYDFFMNLSAVTPLIANGDWPIKSNGTYELDLKGMFKDSAGLSQPFATPPIVFIYKDSSKASITNVQQVFGFDASAGSGGTPGKFSSSITELPIYAMISTQNNTTSFTPQVSVKQNGVIKTLTSGTDFSMVETDPAAIPKWKKIRIDKLPFQGDMVLNFSIIDGSNTDTFPPIAVNYNPIPSIVVYGIYDGDNYSNDMLPDFSGKLTNFNDDTDKQNIVVTINGTVRTKVDDLPHSTFTVAGGHLLKEGPNEIKITGVSQGIPVVTRLTVYYYTNNAPLIDNPIPVPIAAPAAPAKNLVDDGRFIKVSTDTYNTTEKKADVLVHVSNADKLIVMKDGIQYFTVTFNPDGTSTLSAPTDGVIVDTESRIGTAQYPGFRINAVPLNLGSNSYVVKAIIGKITSLIPMTIVRNNNPIQVLSPKLPDEQVINQNFVKLAISADGADSVLLGKTAMTPSSEGEYLFVGTVENLKKGKNTIKYTIVQGAKKTNRQFDVIYANTNTIGGEFSAPIGTSGKINAFNNALSLSFPKGTMLTPANDTTSKLQLFDNAKVLLGIADPIDGRTVKTYNHLGTISTIDPDTIYMQTALTVPVHFGYASPLYWVDAGYYDSTKPGQLTDTMHPYSGEETIVADPFKSNNFSERGSDNRWMKPTGRGTITMQYDPTIRDIAANRLSIWRFGLDGSNYRWMNIGGKVNASNHTVSAPTDSFGYYAVLYNSIGFDDTQSHDFARDDMELLYARGVMNSKNGSEFGAYELTTRGELSTILVKALSLPLNFDPNNALFFDVPHSLSASPYWDYRYIETAGQKGIARGVGTRQFAPDDPVNREQAAIMISNALNLKLSIDLDKSKLNLDKIFADSGKIGVYSRAAVEAVYKAKLMMGRNVTNPAPSGKPLLVFDPQANVTRAEVAKVIVNMMRSKKLL